MKNMQYLTEHCNVNAVYSFLHLFKSLETLTSKRLVVFAEIYSFFKNLPLKNELRTEEKKSWEMQIRSLSARISVRK
jgi:hypothetical protein